MKNRIYLLLLTMIFTALLSCKKEEQNLRIEGVVKDNRELVNQEVSGVQLKLLHNKLEGGSFNTAFTEIGSAATNASGYYGFEFERENTIEYKITGEKTNYFPIEVTINPDNVQPGNTYSKNLTIIPKAAISTRIINNTPEDNNDLITFQFLNASFDCACCTVDNIELEGQTVDSTSICQLYGNTWLKYFYTVDKASSFYTVLDSVYCSSFDTTYVEISY